MGALPLGALRWDRLERWILGSGERPSRGWWSMGRRAPGGGEVLLPGAVYLLEVENGSREERALEVDLPASGAVARTVEWSRPPGTPNRVAVGEKGLVLSSAASPGSALALVGLATASSTRRPADPTAGLEASGGVAWRTAAHLDRAARHVRIGPGKRVTWRSTGAAVERDGALARSEPLRGSAPGAPARCQAADLADGAPRPEPGSAPSSTGTSFLRSTPSPARSTTSGSTPVSPPPRAARLRCSGSGRVALEPAASPARGPGHGEGSAAARSSSTPTVRRAEPLHDGGVVFPGLRGDQFCALRRRPRQVHPLIRDGASSTRDGAGPHRAGRPPARSSAPCCSWRPRRSLRPARALIRTTYGNALVHALCLCWRGTHRTADAGGEELRGCGRRSRPPSGNTAPPRSMGCASAWSTDSPAKRYTTTRSEPALLPTSASATRTTPSANTIELLRSERNPFWLGNRRYPGWPRGSTRSGEPGGAVRGPV